MNRLLLASSRPKRLNNLAAFILLPILSVFALFTYLGVPTVYASDETVFSDANFNNLVYKVGRLNAQRTFPPKVITLVTKDGQEKKLVFSSTTTEIIKELNVQIDFDDLVLPEDSVVSNGGVIQIIKVDIELIKKSEDIPYVTREVETEDLNTGAVSIEQEGVLGVKEKIIKVTHKDGKVVGSELVSTDILLEPVEQILLIGTKPVTIASCDYWGDVVDRIASSDKEKRWMKFVMFRESGCDSGRVSHGSGFYKGLFQFAPATFRNKGGSNIWDGTEQIEIVHQMFNYYSGQQQSDYLKSQWNASHRAYLDKYGW